MKRHAVTVHRNVLSPEKLTHVSTHSMQVFFRVHRQKYIRHKGLHYLLLVVADGSVLAVL
jgi:hypothetical protein